MIDGLILGLHLATAHVDSHYRDCTPGVYARYDNLTVGFVKNSYGHPSEYLGYTLGDKYAVTVGAIHGYPGPQIRPMLIPSMKMGHVRLMLVSDKHARPAGISLGVEF